jgi:hypothetical protein
MNFLQWFYLSNIINIHKDFHCHNIQNKQYVLAAGSFQNRVFVWNIMTMEKALVKVHDITQTLMLSIMH